MKLFNFPIEYLIRLLRGRRHLLRAPAAGRRRGALRGDGAERGRGRRRGLPGPPAPRRPGDPNPTEFIQPMKWTNEQIPQFRKYQQNYQNLENFLRINIFSGFSEKFGTFREILGRSTFCWKWQKKKISWNFSKKPQNSRFFCWKFATWAVQRNANLVDLEQCCKMRLFSLS